MEKKQTLLLTVIAVATLLVAVVGATFAYFTARGDGAASTRYNITTSSTASSSFEVSDLININANQTNFGENATTNVVAEKTNGRVSFTSSDAAGSELSFCYTVSLKVTTNDFVKETGSTTPELLLNVIKGTTAITTTTPTGALSHTTVAANLTTANQAVSGFDITTVANNTTIQIGGKNTLTTTTAGGTSADTWTTRITLVNLKKDQQYNTNKTFNGTLEFAKVDC